MFMTRMALDINRPETQQALADPAILQKAVDQAFNGVRVHAVWRVEQLNHRMHLLMLSPLRPTLHLAHAAYGYPGAFPSWETWNVDDELYELPPQTRLHFRLCAATCAPMPQSESVQHMAQETTASQLTWLLHRCAECGFTTAEGDVEVLQSAWVTWIDPQTSALMTAHHATYDGELTVTDPELFAQAVVSGIGESTRMGAGLMTVDEVKRYRYV